MVDRCHGDVYIALQTRSVRLSEKFNSFIYLHFCFISVVRKALKIHLLHKCWSSVVWAGAPRA